MKRKKLVLTCVALALCLSLFTFGVFAVVSPKVSITGQVSYHIKDASVLVQGKILNAKDYETKQTVHSQDYPTAEINSQSHYYKNSENLQGNETKLEQWDLSTLTFLAGSTEFHPITISLKFTNNSNYALNGTVTFNKETLTGITRETNVAADSLFIDANSSSEFTVVYTLQNKYKTVDLTDIGMTIVIEKATSVSLNYVVGDDVTNASEFQTQSLPKNYVIEEGGLFPTKENKMFYTWYTDEH